MSDTLLEALAAQREQREASWAALHRDARRALILSVLAEQDRRAQSSADENPNPRKPYVSPDLLASEVAHACGLDSTARHGRGAVAGSWSGRRAAALRVVPALRSLVAEGLADSHWQPGVRSRSLYRISAAGRRYLQEDAP